MKLADNWYVILELEFDPPIEDEQKIIEKIEEKSKFWSMHFNDLKGAQYRSWHQNIPKIKRDMIGSNNIRKQLASEACQLVYGPIDKFLRTIGRKGYITSNEGKKLSEKLKITIDVVKKRTKALGIKWVEGTNTDFQSIYDKYYKAKPQNIATYNGIMKQQLMSFGVDNLYDFLYMNTTVKNANKLPYNTLYSKAIEKKKTEFYKTDNISGTGSKLCGQCEIVFKDNNSKETYDKYLEYTKRKSILDDTKSIAEISGELTTEQGDEIIAQLTQVFCDKKLAEDVFTAFCKIEKIPYNKSMSNEKSTDIKICRCGCINDVSDGRKICSNCGLELVIKCPKCGNQNDANIKVCKCGFKFENIDKAAALCEQAEYEINSLDFTIAKEHLNDAEHYWPDNSKIDSLKQRLDEYQKRAGTEIDKMREAVKNKRYYEAKNQYRIIQQLFSGYSDIEVEEEIEQAITKAKNLFYQAKAAKAEKDIFELCSRAYELCIDMPGIRELMPAPANVTGFKVSVNSISRANIISWSMVNDRSIKYVVVRSKDGWVRNLSDGQIIFRGNASSYADRNIKAGIPYYYNVFAERAGIYSKETKGDFKEIVNLFEASKVEIVAKDSSLNISWDLLPSNATAEIYEIQENGIERHIVSSSSSNYVITNLINDKQYKYRLALSYFISEKKQETKGTIIIGVPTCLPQPIDTLRVKSVQENQFEAIWRKTDAEQVHLYASTNREEYLIGDIISIAELEHKMFQIQQQNLSNHSIRNLKEQETGVSFQYLGIEPIYVVAVIVKYGTAILGNLVRANEGEAVEIRDIRLVNGKINIYINPPEDATGFVVLYRLDQFPIDIEDIKTVRKYIPIKQYQLNSAIILDIMEEKKYYFTIYTEFKKNGATDYSSGTEYLFDNSAKVNITYSISINKKIFGESSVVLEFEADSIKFILPEIEIMSAVGNTPMFKASANLFYTIPSQTVNGGVQIKIPFPKNLPKDTYIKAFFKDDSMQRSNQLRLKIKSNYKIS